MGRGVWGDKRTGAAKAGDGGKQAEAFRRDIKEDFVILGDLRRQLEADDAQHNEDRDTTHLHASEICKHDWCPRASWYRITETPQDPEVKAKRGNVAVYQEGHDIHDRIQGALWRLGRLTGEYKCLNCGYIWWTTSPHVCESCGSAWLRYWEVPIEDESIRLLGRGDGLIEETLFGQVLAEIKSVGLGTVRIEVPGLYRQYEDEGMSLYNLWGNIRRPFPSHVRQIMLYLRATKLKTAVAIYQNKWDQGRKEFLLKYSPHVIEPIVVQAQAVVKALEDGTVVRRPDWAEDENSKTCKSCAYRGTCWRLDKKEETSGENKGKTWARVSVH